MKVASKIRLLAATLALSSAIVVGWVMYAGYRESIATLEVEVLEQRAEADVSRLSSALEEVSHDIRLLEWLPEVRGLADGSHRPVRELKDDLAQTFRQLLVSKPHYVQVRLIGAAEEGRELVRIDRTEGGAVRRSDAELQRKGHRDYFLKTREQAPGQIYYSDIDLNRENGRIEEPHRPMLRVAMPVYSSGKTFWGIVIINMDFRGFADEFVGSSLQRFGHYLCNAEGDFLLHPLEERTYGFDRGTRYRVQDEFPELGDFLQSEATAKTVVFDRRGPRAGTLFHLRKVQPLEDGRTIFYGVSARFDEIISASATIVRRTVLVLLVLLLLGLAGAFGVSLLITKPIEKITRAARNLGEGRDDVELPVGRSDEIGVLATSFKEMRRAIKDQEERILEANEKLSTANRDLEHFARISSHELREPLTRIAGLSSLLELEVAASHGEDSAYLAGSLKKEASSALRQITDFRVFSQLGDGEIVRRRTDLNVLVAAVLEGFSAKIESRGVVVSVDEMPAVDVYGNLVRVLFRNLVENALKYGSGEGMRLRIGCERSSQQLVFVVSNTGSTIDSKDRDSIFEVFTRLDKETEGTGVGLSICKRVVERHSGRIWVESDASGTRFKFTLNG